MIFQIYPPTSSTMPLLDIAIEEQHAYYGQFNQHVIDWLKMLYDHGRDKYRPGDLVRC